MKPLFLKLRNIGPFVREEIDFTAVQDMFLVTGRTGSGKTTIFDAMTYALYGETAGYRSHKDVHLHSDYAPEDEDGSVEFTFLLNGLQYRIVRTVERSHTTRTGKKTKKLQTLEFYGRSGQGAQWEQKEGKLSELNEKIKNLIGLSKEEFSQIVLLPQGEFARFLHEDPSNKKNTLAKLFPVEFYTSLCQQAKTDADSARQELEALRRALEADCDGFNAEDSARRLQEISTELAAMQESHAACTEGIRKLGEKKKELADRLEDARTAAMLQQKQAVLNAQKDAVQAQEARLARAEEAEKLGEALRGRDAAQQRLQQAQSRQAEVQAKLSAALARQQELARQEGQNEEQRRQLEACGIALYELDTKLSQAQERAKAQQAFRAAEAHVARLYAKTAPAGQRAAEELASCTEERERCRTLIQKLEAEIKALREQQQHEKDTNAAAAMAEQLKDGLPCPVCGSTSHPAPAAFLHTGICFDERIIADESSLENLQQKEQSLSQREAQLQEAARLITLMTEHLQDAAARTQTALPAAAELPRRTDPTPTPNHIAAYHQEVTAAVEELARTAAQCRSTGEDGGGTEELLLHRKELERQQAALRQETDSFAQAQEYAGRQCSSLQGEARSLARQLESLSGDFAAASEGSAAAVAASSFGSEADVRAALLSPEEAARLRQSCTDWHESLRTVETQLAVHHAGDPEALALALEQAEQELAQQQQKNEELVQAREKLAAEQATLQDREQRIARGRSRLEAKEKEYAPLLALAGDINGNNPKKVQLDSWVLGTYLEEVVTAANLRFSKVSSGRYRFILRTEKEGGKGFKGLDITVSDTYTGRERSTASLSGGETFMASLSLALALTDVVQQKSGGIRLDSLFIDEGFGSLDGETLDSAVSILNEVREQRMVGIISHVESLAGAIPSHIAVTKTNSGSSICIRQA